MHKRLVYYRQREVTGMPYTIEELRRIITPIAQAHGLRSVSLFGSYSKGTARRDSDVDLKIEKGSVMSLFQLSGLRLAMEDALKVPVDLVTNDASNREFLDMIVKNEVTLYQRQDAITKLQKPSAKTKNIL